MSKSWGGALLAFPKVPNATHVPNVRLCTQPRGGQTPLPVFGVTAEEHEDIIRGDSAPWTGV